MGIDSIGKSAPMKITCPSTGYSQTLEFVDYGEFEFPLGGVTETGTFELEIELEGDGEYFFDNIGIPSLVQVEPILEISDQTISLDTYLATSDTVEISNPGGTDLIWYIEHDADWLTTDPVNGINETTVLISANENPVNEVRTAILTITGPNARNSPATITVNQPASTASIDLEDKSFYALKVYPNPNTGEFEVNLTGLEPGDLILRLNSILGKEVWTMSTTTGEHEWHKKVSIENLKKGIYFLSVDSGQGRLRQVVIIR